MMGKKKAGQKMPSPLPLPSKGKYQGSLLPKENKKKKKKENKKSQRTKQTTRIKKIKGKRKKKREKETHIEFT